MKRIVFACLAVALTASIASAQGINLSWNDCGNNGSLNQAFTCDSNSGNNVMVASFLPPPAIDHFVGLSSQIDINTDQASLPDWWKHGTGQCRSTSGLVVNFDFPTGPFSCADFFLGQAAGGFAYDVGYGSPARARLRIQCAVPFEQNGPVTAGTEYYAYKVSLLRAKTTGTGSCAGCNASACIVLNEIQLFQPPEQLNDPEMFNPADRNYVTWQLPTSGPSGCPLATPTRSSSWGQLKSLYR